MSDCILPKFLREFEVVIACVSGMMEANGWFEDHYTRPYEGPDIDGNAVRLKEVHAYQKKGTDDLQHWYIIGQILA